MSAKPDLIVVETTGDFMLMDIGGGQLIEAFRPCLVKRSAFVTQRLDRRQLRIVDDAPREKTDSEVEKTWKADGYTKSQKNVVTRKVLTGISKAQKAVAKGAPQQPGESDDAYLLRLEAEEASS